MQAFARSSVFAVPEDLKLEHFQIRKTNTKQDLQALVARDKTDIRFSEASVAKQLLSDTAIGSAVGFDFVERVRQELGEEIDASSTMLIKSGKQVLALTRSEIVEFKGDKVTRHKLTHLRRWAASESSLTLDFGDYEDDYSVMKLDKARAEQASQFIGSQIDLILKMRCDTATLDDDDEAEVEVVPIAEKEKSISQSLSNIKARKADKSLPVMTSAGIGRRSQSSRSMSVESQRVPISKQAIVREEKVAREEKSVAHKKAGFFAPRSARRIARDKMSQDKSSQVKTSKDVNRRRVGDRAKDDRKPKLSLASKERQKSKTSSESSMMPLKIKLVDETVKTFLIPVNQKVVDVIASIVSFLFFFFFCFVLRLIFV